MHSTARSVSKIRFATAQKIRTIDFSRSGIAGTGSLSPRARRTLAVYLILVKWDYGGISAPMGAIADAVYRSSCGEGGSIRTLQRANKELEERGYISTANYRPGVHSKGALIHFNLEAFAFWTRKPTKQVTPIPTPSHNVVSRETMCDTVPHTTSWQASDRTRDNVRVKPPEYIPKKKQEPRAGARAINNNRPKKNLVLFTVGIVLGAMKLHRIDRRAARARARCEIDAVTAGAELLNPSGVDWAFWEKRWAEMPIDVRESTARREIVPALLGLDRKKPKPTAPPPPTPPAPNPLPLPPAAAPTAEEIRAIRETLETKFSLPAPPEASTPAPAPVELERDDLAVLLAARDRARSRINCG